MLAKLSWRILRNSGSLIFKVLRSKYFKDEDFLNAIVGSNPSLTWTGVTWDRDLFKKGFRWKVGNDNCINIENDLCVDIMGSRKSISTPNEFRGKRVATLIAIDHKWDKKM